MAKDHPPPSGLRTFAFLVAEIAIIVCLGVTVVFIVQHPGPLKEVSAISLYANYDWHAVLNTFGFVGFAFNAIMAFRMFPGSHTVRKGVHMFMHTVAFGSSCLAVYLMFKFHNINQIPNMYSTHSVVGMAALVMFGTQWFMGVMGFFMPMTPGWMRFMALPFHKFFGVATMVAVTAAMVLGAMDRQRITWELGGTPDYTMVSDQWANAYAMCVLAAALTTGFVLSQASESMPTLEQAKKEAGGSELSRAISSNSGRDDYAKLSGYGADARA